MLLDRSIILILYNNIIRSKAKRTICMLKITKQKLEEIELSHIHWENQKKHIAVTELELNVVEDRRRFDRKIPKKYLNYFESRRKMRTQEPEQVLPELHANKNFLGEERFQKQQNKKHGKSKKNTMLLNEMIEILKTGNQSRAGPMKAYNHKKRKILTEESQDFNEFNEFINRQSRTSKNNRPKIIENEITRMGNPCNVVRRKLHSEQKSRVKMYSMNNESSEIYLKTQKKEPQLLTFYGKGILNFKDSNGKTKIGEADRRLTRNLEEQTNQFMDNIKVPRQQ